MKERKTAAGHVVAAGGIAKERFEPAGRVVGATTVLIERLKTKPRVVGACGEADKHPTAVGCVEASHNASRVCCLRVWRKRQADEHQRDEHQTAPQRRAVNRISYG